MTQNGQQLLGQQVLNGGVQNGPQPQGFSNQQPQMSGIFPANINNQINNPNIDINGNNNKGFGLSSQQMSLLPIEDEEHLFNGKYTNIRGN
jgi:hypothetical protein